MRSAPRVPRFTQRAAARLRLAVVIAVFAAWGSLAWVARSATDGSASAGSEVRTCLVPTAGVEPDDAAARALADVLAAVRRDDAIGAPMLDRAAALGVAVCIEPGLTSAYSGLDPIGLRILLAADLEPGAQVAFLVHELRHLDALVRGYCPSVAMPLGDVDRLVLASEADAQAVATLVAWRLADSGDPSAWTALLATEDYTDIAVAFELEMFRSGDQLSATRAAFAQWYAEDDRVGPYHMLALAQHLKAQRTLGVPAVVEPVPEGWYDDFCALPGGLDYEGMGWDAPGDSE